MNSQDNKLGQFQLSNGAVAYSGHGARSLKIGRRFYSHILQPRDGWPSDKPSSSVVFAPSATEADAIATALATMGTGPALDWVNGREQTEALLIDNDGRHHASNGWYQYFEESHLEAGQNTNSKASTYYVNFSLAKISGGNYRKPYVAVWIENTKGKLIKNLLLLGDSERWMSKNSYWWRRQGRQNPDFLHSFARPTRRAGEYQLIWQGRDDFGNSVMPSNYKLVIEAAREHGGHEKISIPFELGKPIKQTEKGHSEIDFIQLKIN